MSNIPTRGSKAVVAPSEASAAVEPEASPFAPPAPAPKKFDLSGRYRVREGFSVAHGARNDSEGHVGHHARAVAGDIVHLSHEDALVVIRHTQSQRDPATGRAHGPAIETEEVYNARIEAERQNAEFMKQLIGVDPVL